MKKGLVAVAAFFLAFVGGYRYASALYESDIAEMKEEFAASSAAMSEEYRAKERFAMQSMADAWDQRDAAYALLRERESDFKRLRSEADSAKRRLSSVSSSACKTERKQLERCADLLSSGAGLLERGVELSAKTSIDKDTIVRIVAQ